MTKIKIGVSASPLALPLRRALQAIQPLEVPGVELDASGEMSPKNLSQTGRREVRQLIRNHELELTAVGCPLRHSLDTPENMEARLDHVKNVMTMSYDLGSPFVLIQTGKLPTVDAGSPLMVEALISLAQHADRVGVVLAMETGWDSGADTARFLERFDTNWLAVNVAPGNLLMSGYSLADELPAFGKHVVYCRANDARKASANRNAAEVPVGHGDVDWLHFVGLLEEIDYRGWLTLKCPLMHAEPSVKFLRRIVR